MKKNKKIIFFVILSIILIYCLGNVAIKNRENNYLFQLKSYIPNSIKHYLKNSIFLLSSLEDKISQLEQENEILKKKIKYFQDTLQNQNRVELIFNENKKINSKNNNYSLEIYQLLGLGNGKSDSAIASVYLENFKDKILLINGDGQIYYLTENNIDQNVIKMNKIQNNIDELVKYENFFRNSQYGIKDIFIDDNNSKILFSTGSFGHSTLAQEENSIFGKILSLDTKKNGDYQKVSLGHRNVQGLKYEEELDRIYISEHGPIGGDEFNINSNPEVNNLKNFGWPISSYGEHYGNPKKNNKKYVKAPLYKSHTKYGFVEPIKYFTPSIGISEILKVPNKFNNNFGNIFFISSMGNNIEEGDLSIHYLKLNELENKILKEDIIKIGYRIRDMMYHDNLNKIILSFEDLPGVGFLSLDK
jgi:glucose/arabinose dehydrogenase